MTIFLTICYCKKCLNRRLFCLGTCGCCCWSQTPMKGIQKLLKSWHWALALHYYCGTRSQVSRPLQICAMCTKKCYMSRRASAPIAENTGLPLTNSKLHQCNLSVLIFMKPLDPGGATRPTEHCYDSVNPRGFKP